MFLNQVVLFQDMGKEVIEGASNSRVRYPLARIASEMQHQFYETARARIETGREAGFRVLPLLSLELGRDAKQISVLAPLPCGQVPF